MSQPVTNSATGSRNLSDSYQRIFEITGGGIMETLMGMGVEVVEQLGKAIRLHHDTYIQEVLAE
jgi:hypothetical protein